MKFTIQTSMKYLLMKMFVNVKEDWLEEETERNADVWSPNVQQITQKMEFVLMAVVTREDVVREHRKLHIVTLDKVHKKCIRLQRL